MKKIDITQAPCYPDVTEFGWTPGNTLDENGDIVGTVTPNNPLCRECDYFKYCIKQKTEHALALSSLLKDGVDILYEIVQQVGEDFIQQYNVTLSIDTTTKALREIIATMFEDIKSVVVSDLHDLNKDKFKFIVRKSLVAYEPYIRRQLEKHFLKN